MPQHARARRYIGVAALLAGLIAAMIGTSLGPATAAERFSDRDCSDFSTQASAQAFFNAAGPGDPHRLDSDGDGIACETNPCPCSTDTNPTPTTTPTLTPIPTPTPSPTATPTTTATTTPIVQTPLVVERGNVVKVTDGDTLKVRLKTGKKVDVRILGIDTPELRGGSRRCGGREAADSLERLAPVGSTVALKSDRTQDLTDKYGRALRYVTRGGKDVGLQQIRLGHSKAYVYDKPVTRHRAYKKAENQAKRLARGAWTSCWR